MTTDAAKAKGMTAFAIATRRAKLYLTFPSVKAQKMA